MSPFMKISVLGPSISSGVGDTDPAIAKQKAKYMNAGFKDAKADKFNLISAFVRIYFKSMQQNRQQRAEGPKATKHWNIDVEVDRGSYRMSCNLALRKPRYTDLFGPSIWAPWSRYSRWLTFVRANLATMVVSSPTLVITILDLTISCIKRFRIVESTLFLGK